MPCTHHCHAQHEWVAQAGWPSWVRGGVAAAEPQNTNERRATRPRRTYAVRTTTKPTYRGMSPAQDGRDAPHNARVAQERQPRDWGWGGSGRECSGEREAERQRRGAVLERAAERTAPWYAHT